MTGIYLDHEMTDSGRREVLFRGDFALYGARESSTALAGHARAMIVEAFDPHPPEHAQDLLDVPSFIERVGPLKARFTNDDHTKELVSATLFDLGCDLERTYFDVPRLRVVPCGGYLTSGVSYAYKAHRDIWYSSPAAQLNYWIPVSPVVPTRAMVMYPTHFSKAVPNSSAGFDYGEWCRVGRQQAAQQIGEDTRKHPLPLEPVDLSDEELRIAPTTGGLLMFSACHLHATAPNESAETRFSIDFRTVNRDDLEEGVGGPNVDSEAQGTTLGDFLRASDYAPLDLASL